MKPYKIISALLALAVSVSAAGCGSSGDESTFGHKSDIGTAASSSNAAESSAADGAPDSSVSSDADSADSSRKEDSSKSGKETDKPNSGSSKADEKITEKPVVTTAKQTAPVTTAATAAPVTTTTATAAPVTTTAKPDTTTPKPETEPPADIAEEYVWNYGGISLTIPKSLYGKYVVEDGTLYCKSCYDKEAGTGAVLYLMSRDDPTDVIIPNGYLLGMDYSGNYYFCYTPTGATYDVTDQTLNADYNELCNGLDEVIVSARGEASPYSEPIGFYRYCHQTEPSLRGMWRVSGMEGAQVAPTVIFDGDRGRFQYFGFSGVDDNIYGRILYNSNVPDYEWNNPSKWGDFGLVFLNGVVYKVTCYYGAPHSVSFECVMGYDDVGLSGMTFFFEKDYEALYEYW